ncbi:MAG TPA: uroporphyrinogen-III synthase [Candidatus Dormibacteraeota bacterium]|jgi:uroporphyrinogen-III synthase|nr:uroporphyrinogen-III synthase [Candidatus Dormibacteraeota bacterium]
MTDYQPDPALGTSLSGMTIGLLQTRNGQILADLISRRGGTPMLAPTLREEEVADPTDVKALLAQALAEPLAGAVFQTGVGTRRIYRIVEEMALIDALNRRLAETVVVARGPKPLAVLLKAGVRVDRRTGEPHTTEQLLPLLSDLRSGNVLVQHHGARNQELVDRLVTQGVVAFEVVTYAWAFPEDLGPVLDYLSALESGRVDATLFTSASQVQNLFGIAQQRGIAQLGTWLRERTAVASVGPVTTEALQEWGVDPKIEPEHPKMVPLVDAVSRFFATRQP